MIERAVRIALVFSAADARRQSVFDLGHHVRDDSPEGDAAAALQVFNSYCGKNGMSGMALGEQKNDIITDLVAGFKEKLEEDKQRTDNVEELVVLEVGSHCGDGSLSILVRILQLTFRRHEFTTDHCFKFDFKI